MDEDVVIKVSEIEQRSLLLFWLLLGIEVEICSPKEFDWQRLHEQPRKGWIDWLGGPRKYETDDDDRCFRIARPKS